MGGGTKEHVEKIRKSKFDRQRAETATLRSNCGSEGYVFTHNGQAAGQCEFHHVLPVETVQDGNILGDTCSTEEKDFLYKCMCMTTWDTNEQPNLIGLPTKRPYYDADKKVLKGFSLADLKALSPQAGEFGSLPDLPCHLNDHNRFNIEVIEALDAEVWSKLLEDGEKCKFKGRSIRAMLRAQSNAWKAELRTRGERDGGAAECWVNRHTPAKRMVWHFPLSMAASPDWSEPPPNVSSAGATVRAWLKTIFAWGP